MKKGFTLIEMAVLIGILAILAVIAIPTYVNLRQAAADAATAGVAGAAASASVINFSAKSAGTSYVALTDCTDFANTTSGVLAGGLPAGYTISGSAVLSDGATAACTVKRSNPDAHVTFQAIGAAL